MRTIICNSTQSFLDMAENDFLKGMDVHCVFPITETVKKMIMHCQRRHNIGHITFTETTMDVVSAR
jgi:hypothetical protein